MRRFNGYYERFYNVDFELVLGNHDILEPEVYRSLDFETTSELIIGNWILTNEPLIEVDSGKINPHGHIHPGIVLHGKGRQAMKFRCFHQTERHF
jgi:uncharacterized protein